MQSDRLSSRAVLEPADHGGRGSAILGDDVEHPDPVAGRQLSWSQPDRKNPGSDLLSDLAFDIFIEAPPEGRSNQALIARFARRATECKGDPIAKQWLDDQRFKIGNAYVTVNRRAKQKQNDLAQRALESLSHTCHPRPGSI